MHDLEIKNLKNEVLEAFRLFSDSKFTGCDPLLAVSRITFGADGPVVEPASFEFLGFGVGPEGEAFSQTGSVDLSWIFGDTWLDEEVMEKKFNEACQIFRDVLSQVANSSEFLKIPKTSHVIFILSISDQFQSVLCRIGADGTFQLPPEKK